FHLARNGRSFLIYFALLAIKLLSGVSFCKNLNLFKKRIFFFLEVS
ncbi:hypothetical protein AAKU61_001905, partial [Undibacterium sp. GrIS 1.2]